MHMQQPPQNPWLNWHSPGYALEYRKSLLGDFFLSDENKGVIQLTLHGFSISDEVRGDVTPIKLHALHHF